MFRQERVGLNERVFILRKFRTMTLQKPPVEKSLPDAHRLGTFGKILRASSLDELPSLYNILIGDMSFVGPRPLLTEYLTLYSQEQRKRHLVRPGLTGLAQVNGRNELPWKERLTYDVFYAENLNAWLDFKILVKTFPLVFSGKGVVAPGSVSGERFRG